MTPERYARVKAEAAERIRTFAERRREHEASLERRMVLECNGCIGRGQIHEGHYPFVPASFGSTRGPVVAGQCWHCGIEIEPVLDLAHEPKEESGHFIVDEIDAHLQLGLFEASQ